MTTSERISEINKTYGWNYQLVNGRVFQMFMGKKMYTTIDKLNNKVANIEFMKVVNENSRMVIEHLKANGYELIKGNSDSAYYHKGNKGIVRVSNHSNMSDKYFAPAVNAYSEVKGGYVELIEQINNL